MIEVLNLVVFSVTIGSQLMAFSKLHDFFLHQKELIVDFL
jgi:hypothetical protein